MYRCDIRKSSTFEMKVFTYFKCEIGMIEVNAYFPISSSLQMIWKIYYF